MDRSGNGSSADTAKTAAAAASLADAMASMSMQVRVRVLDSPEMSAHAMWYSNNPIFCIHRGLRV